MGAGMLGRVRTWTLTQIEQAVRGSWGRDTCDPNPKAVAEWHLDNPARGQCGITALVLQDLLGGDLLLAEVTAGGEWCSWHYWNRLVGGLEVDLTREQFRPDEHVGEPRVVHRPEGGPRRGAEQYALLRERVFGALEPTPTEAPGAADSPA